MRKLLTPKWLGLHALAILMIAAFILLAFWQLQRGQEGNARSWGYAFQWPAFAIFVVYMWVKMVREELHPNPDEPRQAKAVPGPPADGVRPTTTAVVEEDDDEDDPELDAQLQEYNQWLASLNERTPR